MRKIEIPIFCIREVEEIEKRTHRVFFDSSGRPKITPRHESAVIVMLEDHYAPWKVKTALENLEKMGRIVGVKKMMGKKVGEAKFYFPSPYDGEEYAQKMQKKIDTMADWIKKYSDNEITSMVGWHLHDVVKAELRALNFEIKSENTKKYRGADWPKSRKNLDIIAKHKTRKLTIGVEIKNSLQLAPLAEISEKIEICKHLGITPVFACRWLEPYHEEIKMRGGFLWQFKKQLYPRGQEDFVETLRKRFRFPIEVSSQLPVVAVRKFEKWLKQF